MKARLENNEIKIYSKIPNSFQAGDILVAGGGKNLSEETLQSYGFYDLVRPEYDSRIEELANLHLDGDVYTYDVIDKPIKQTVAELKEQKISNLKHIIGSQLAKTDWYIIRESDSGEATPQSIKDERAALRTQSNDIEAQINALTTKKSVVLFDINL
jgi:hypothetical protein